MAQILDGKAVSKQILETIKKEVEAMAEKPGLAVILVGEDPASAVYVANKEKACQNVGFFSRKVVLPESTSPEALYAVIDDLNADPAIHGILCQFPLPASLRQYEAQVIQRIRSAKDVDGFKAGSGFVPCTPKGIMRLLEVYKIDPAGKHAVVLGRSNLVGKPVANLLLDAHATVTICHSKTQDIESYIQSADILIAAIGKPTYVIASMVKPGAVVVDVGINRTDHGLVGDVDFEGISSKASFITPVPGGVGPMTIAMLMENVLEAYKKLSPAAD